jgi:hypothetical protein
MLAHWVIVYFEQFLGNYQSWPQFWATLSHTFTHKCWQKMDWVTFWANLSPNHLVTLVLAQVFLLTACRLESCLSATCRGRRAADGGGAFFTSHQTVSLAGLPDGIFSIQKSRFGKFWKALEWKIYIYIMVI